MNWLTRLLHPYREETRAAPPAGDFYFQEFAANRSYGGIGYGGYAGEKIVLSHLAVAARCVALRSELLASVPLFLFRRTADGGRERADDNPLYSVLHDMANENLSAFELRELLVRSLDLYGNAYAVISWNARGQVVALEPIHTVQIDRVNGRLRYRGTRYNRNREETFLQEEVLHLRGPTRDGLIGLSPIGIARGALGLALQQSAVAENLVSNGLRSSGVLSYDHNLSKEQAERARDQLTAHYTGVPNAGKILLTDGGAKFTAMSFSPEDSQFLESRKLANEDIARIFGLPPTCVGLVDKATYSNTEQESRALVQNALGPLAARIEAGMSRCLLSDVGRRNYYVEHDLSGLLRGDVAARFAAYRLAREIGAMSANDVRRLENMPPIADGDGFAEPANWKPLGAPVAGS
jgi:HK97 family phage portal protein